MSTPQNGSPLRIAVLLSGAGRTLQNLVAQVRDGKLPAEIVLVISDREGITGIERAREAGLAHVTIARKGQSLDAFSREIAHALDAARVDLVCMAGFLSLWEIPERYRGRVMNIHPALLPKFGGKGFHGDRVHEAVLSAGEEESGCTVHFADNEYDHGPIILQRRIAVLPDDTPDMLAARVFEQECIAYPEAIRMFANGRVTPNQNTM